MIKTISNKKSMRCLAIPYQDEEVNLEGFVARQTDERRPLVILCHAWKGKDDFICEKARKVAEWGYVGFALDMYGKNVLGKTKEENAILKKPFIENRSLLQKRVLKGYAVASALPYVDATRIAVIGFGFGGICALDLARSGAELKGAVSIYGHFDPPPTSLLKSIKAKILIHHGYSDPITSLTELSRFEKEMEDAKVDWQAHIYGGTAHAFANPEANDPEAGILYHPNSASRAWTSTRNFLNEIFNSGVS